MTVRELNRDQLIELKQTYIDNYLMENENRNASYGELIWADELVDDDTVFENFGMYDFVDEDFFCTAGNC